MWFPAMWCFWQSEGELSKKGLSRNARHSKSVLLISKRKPLLAIFIQGPYVEAVIRLIWCGCVINVVDDYRVHRDLFRLQFESELFFDGSEERWQVRVGAVVGGVTEVDVEKT